MHGLEASVRPAHVHTPCMYHEFSCRRSNAVRPTLRQRHFDQYMLIVTLITNTVNATAQELLYDSIGRQICEQLLGHGWNTCVTAGAGDKDLGRFREGTVI